MTIYAYLRVSTNDKGQTTDNQKENLLSLGYAIDQFVVEQGVSGTINALDRPAFKKMMNTLVAGDVVLCTMLDRLGRNAVDVMTTIERFTKAGVALKVVQLGGVDLTSSMGKLIVGVLSCVAELERNMISERTVQGLARTKAAGTLLGKKLRIPPDVLETCCKERKLGVEYKVLADRFGYDKSTLAQNMAKWGDKMEEYKGLWEKRIVQIGNKETKTL